MNHVPLQREIHYKLVNSILHNLITSESTSLAKAIDDSSIELFLFPKPTTLNTEMVSNISDNLMIFNIKYSNFLISFLMQDKENMKMYDIFGTREIKQQTKNYSMTIWKQSDDLMNNFKEFLFGARIN